jgi:hypothetical protein
MMNYFKTYWLYLSISGFFALALISCQKDIDINLPDPEIQIVVDGFIESGNLPFVTLTHSSAYFSESSSELLFDSYVHDAEITITVDGNNFDLTEICTSNIPDSLLPLFAELTGIPITSGLPFDICIYTILDFNFSGEAGKTYHLKIEAEGKTLTATTVIPHVVPLDSVWFKVEANLDSLGFAWARMNDPDTIGNAYRWYARRINHYPNGDIKDPVFIPPFNSVTDDQFFNGLVFDFSAARGRLPFSDKEDDHNEEAFFFKVGDTIAVKGCSTDLPTFLFFRSFYQELGNQGSPFASPSSLRSNVDGGLGVWAGYGVYNDTIIATK